jgi:hypothetical protein
MYILFERLLIKSISKNIFFQYLFIAKRRSAAKARGNFETSIRSDHNVNSVLEGQLIEVVYILNKYLFFDLILKV